MTFLNKLFEWAGKTRKPTNEDEFDTYIADRPIQKDSSQLLYLNREVAQKYRTIGLQAERPNIYAPLNLSAIQQQLMSCKATAEIYSSATSNNESDNSSYSYSSDYSYSDSCSTPEDEGKSKNIKTENINDVSKTDEAKQIPKTDFTSLKSNDTSFGSSFDIGKKENNKNDNISNNNNNNNNNIEEKGNSLPKFNMDFSFMNKTNSKENSTGGFDTPSKSGELSREKSESFNIAKLDFNIGKTIDKTSTEKSSTTNNNSNNSTNDLTNNSTISNNGGNKIAGISFDLGNFNSIISNSEKKENVAGNLTTAKSINFGIGQSIGGQEKKPSTSGISPISFNLGTSDAGKSFPIPTPPKENGHSTSDTFKFNFANTAISPIESAATNAGLKGFSFGNNSFA